MSSTKKINLFNAIKFSNKKESYLLKIPFSQKCMRLLHSLLYEGLIRGFFVVSRCQIKEVHILLKKNVFYSNYPFRYKFSDHTKYKILNGSMKTDLNFLISESNRCNKSDYENSSYKFKSKIEQGISFKIY